MILDRVFGSASGLAAAGGVDRQRGGGLCSVAAHQPDDLASAGVESQLVYGNPVAENVGTAPKTQASGKLTSS